MIAAAIAEEIGREVDYAPVETDGALGESGPPWYLVLGLPVGSRQCALGSEVLLPVDGGRAPLDGLSADPKPLSHAPGIALAALGTLAFGAVG